MKLKKNNSVAMSESFRRTVISKHFSARKVLSSIVAATLVATSAVPASADSFFFRYKQPASWAPGSDPEIPTDPQLGVGNDITIFFTGAIGIPFSKLIPVKTKDVAEWRFQSGTLQDGLGLDPSTGIVSGTPGGKTTQKKAVLVGYDVGGHLIARAAITSRFHNPAGQATDFTFYGHTNKYMYRQIPATVPIAKWESIGDLPDDFHTETRYFAGTPSQEYTTGVGFIGYDYMDKEVAFTYGDLIVQDTPVIEHIDDRIRHPSKNFVVTPTVQYRIGELKYRLVALDGKPASTGFNTKTGRLSTRIPTFNTSMRFKIEVTDVDGVVGSSNVFKLTTASPDVDMANMRNQTGTVNQAYSLQITGKDLSGDVNWKVLAGQLPDGLSLDAETGEISGIPTRVETKTGIVIGAVTSDGGSGQTPAFDFTIYPEEISVAFQPVETRVGRPFVTAGPTMGTGIKSPFSFDLAAGAVLDDAISVDYDTVVVSGTAETAGDYSVPFDFTNGDGRQKTFVQPITIHDLLALEYEPEITVYRRTPVSVQPSSVAGVIGVGEFKLTSGTLPKGLSIDPSSGDIVGTPEEMGSAVDLTVTLSDESGETIASNDFEIEVQDRPPVEVAAAAVQVERFVDNAVTTTTSQNVYDGVTYELVAGTLPDGLTFDEDGVIRGNTQELVGEYGGLQVQATDGEGYVGLSPVFSVTVIEPKNLAPLNLANGTSDVDATWAEDVPFAFDLPVPANAFGTVAYDFQALPDGIAVVGGQLVGTVAESGIYVFPFTLIDDARRTLSGNFTLTILEPMSATLSGRGKMGDEETDDVSFELPRGGDTIISPVIKDAIGNVTYTYQGTLPDGLSYADGKITGKPTTQDQTGEFTLVLTDEAGSTVNLHAKVLIGARVPLTLSYAVPSPAGFVGISISPIKPSVVDSIGAVTYTQQGALPPGISFDGNTGYFYGVPTEANWFQGIEVTATDSEGSSFAGTYGPVAMGISMKGNPVVPGTTTFTVRAGEPFVQTLDVTNAIKPVVFGTPSGDPLPYGLTLGQFDGKISGMFPAAGKYVAGAVTAIDSFSREKTTNVKFVAVGPLDIAAPATTTFNQYSSVSAQSVATNVIGTAKYELATGTLPSFLSLNPNTGYIAGPADTKGVWGGLTIKVTDSTGSSASTDAFSIAIGDRLPLELNTADTYNLVANKNYKLAMPVANAVGAVTFIQTGALPEGISFDAKVGRFSGVAKVIGSFPVSVTVTDSVGASVTKAFSLVIDTNGYPINLTVTDFVTKVGEPISTKLPVYSNHVGTVQFWADETLADYGLTIDPDTGVISGTATQLMDFTPNVNISDASLRVTSKPISIKVVPDLVANVPARIDLPVNKRVYPYMYVSADNGIGALDWSIEGTLPKGLSFSTRLRRFAGTPTEMGTFPIKLTVAERDGFKQSSTVAVEVVVVSDGVAPTVRVTPSTVGYYTHQNSTITPVYQNAKTGDVLDLAPDSAPLPPGVTFRKNSSGADVLYHAVGATTDAGIYPGIKVRVTSSDGLYGDSEPFTLVLKTAFSYEYRKLDVRAYDPVSVPAPAPISGKPVGNVTYSFASDYSGGTLKVDPVTGLLTGYVTKSGSVSVRVTDTYNGATLRSVTYVVTFTAKVLSVKTPAQQVTFTGINYPSYVTTMTNGSQNAVMSLGELVPPGLSVDPVTGTISGIATTAGVYPTTLVYTDPNQTLVTPFTATVEQSAPAGKGYKFLKVAVTSRNDHISNLSIRSASGSDIMHMVSKGAGNLSVGVYNQLVGPHNAITFPTGGFQEFELPTYVDKGSIEARGHGSATVVYSASVDGQTWVEIGTQVNSGAPKASFQFKEATDLFAFNANAITPAPAQVPYSFDLKTLVDASSLDGISASNLAWTWSVDPNRDTSTTMATLPAGISISGSTLTGTPTVEGTYAVVLKGAYGGRSVSKAFQIVVPAPGPLFVFNSTALPQGMAQFAYSFDMRTLVDASTLQGITTSSLSWTWAADPNRNTSTTMADLPAGLAISGATLRGTPTTEGTYAVVLTGTYGGRSVSKSFQLVVTPLVASMSLQGATLQSGERWVTPFNVDMFPYLTAPGVTLSEVKWTVVTSGVVAQSGEAVALPAELALGNTTGAITGTSSSVGKWRFAIKATWKTLSAQAEYVIEITGEPTNYKFTKLSAGDNYTCGITTSGKVACWGNGGSNRLGYNNATNSAVPVDVAGIAKDASMIALGTGSVTTCATTSTGAMMCWGGTGEITGMSGPYARLSPNYASGVTDIAMKSQHACYITSGAVKCQGWNGDSMAVGLSASNYWVSSPNTPSGLTTGYKEAAVGTDHSCALSTAGAVKCWGLRTNGRLGNGSIATTAVSAPVNVTGLTSGVKAIAAGADFTCAITSASGVKCWGNNNNGQIGDGKTTQAPAAVDVNGLTSNVKEIAAGTNHACALTNSGAVKCWGNNGYGKLGNGLTLTSSAPVDVVGLDSGVASITAGANHTCALMTSGDYKCWGLNTSGQLGDGTLVNRPTP
jgi:alpha-tubulin suppressor-like RCC1 family protein